MWPRRRTDSQGHAEDAQPSVDPPAEAEWIKRAGKLAPSILPPFKALLTALHHADALVGGDEAAWLTIAAKADDLEACATAAKAALGVPPTQRTADVQAVLTALFDEAHGSAAAITDGLEHPERFISATQRIPDSMTKISALAERTTEMLRTIAEWAKEQPKSDDVRPARRPAISAAVRGEVWRRDQGKCVDCHGRERLEYDHIIPFSRGGSNTARNLELRCEACNRRKGARV